MILGGKNEKTKSIIIFIPLNSIERILIVKTENRGIRIGISDIKRTEEEDIEHITKYGEEITKEQILEFFES